MKTFLSAVIFTMILTLFSSCNSTDSSEALAVSEIVPAAELINQAEDFFRQRDNVDNVRKGISLLKRARLAETNNFESAWKLARLDYNLGDRTTDEKEREKAFKEGIAAGKTAVRLDPSKPDGYFWLGANLGGQAKQDTLSGAANVAEIKTNMQKVIEIQETYQGATAYVALAQVELNTTGLLGGSAEKAKDYLEKALAIEKGNSYIYLYLAESYLALNRKADAKKMLDSIKTLPINPEFAYERKDTLDKAKKLEEKL